MNPTEAQIQAAIITFLKLKKYYVQRLNSGALITQKGVVRLAEKGTGDLLVGIPVNGIVAMGFIEVKTEKGKLNTDQEKFQKQCQEKNIPYIIARSIEDAERGINEYITNVL